MPQARQGDRVNNYLLEAKIGAGTFGEVWRARHHVFGDVVAVKIPTEASYVRNLQREGVVVHGLRHPNIVRVLDLDPYSDPPYLIMEYVDGPSLRTAIDHCKGLMPIQCATAIMRGILNALTAAHAQGIIHRDIKPPNVLLQHPLDQLVHIRENAVKVTDFGLGQVGGQTAQSMMQSGSLGTDTGRSLSGTLAYMSPEQKEGRPVDARSDLYSCGIVLFEMLTGERPQGNDMPSTLRPHAVMLPLDHVFSRAYARYERRFASAEEMLAALPDHFRENGWLSPPAPPVTARRARNSSNEDGSVCPGCGGNVLGADQFCIHCGQQLAASVPRCPACHGFPHRGDQFCTLCGKDLRVLAT
jgi:serine/threonine-protein kinase